MHWSLLGLLIAGMALILFGIILMVFYLSKRNYKKSLFGIGCIILGIIIAVVIFLVETNPIHF